METQSGIKFLVLEGTPRERGRIYGETLGPMIAEFIERWKYRLSMATGMDPDRYLGRFLEETGLVAAVKKWAPKLLEEVEGIGEGAGVDFNTIFAYQCADEERWYRDSFKRWGSGGCSALGCFREGDAPALLAQNMDIPGFYDGSQVLLRIKHPESPLESLVFTTAGMIALCGVNSRPVGICCNTLGDLSYAADGLPVAFIVRSVLEQPSLEEAVKFIHGVKHASGQNYTMGGAEKVACFECSANKVSQYIPYEGARRVWHTNHPLVNDDLILPPRVRAHPGTSHPRLRWVESRMRDPSKSITPETAKHILSSHEGPVCVHNNHQPTGALTFGSLVYVLSSPPELHIAPGPPCSTGWKTFRF